ncbi:MAG: NYN domain-containing protein [Armatimonadetes bacterium]|nr:NYN domain-containing protein [Armatimonadota bacterium]
MAVERVAAYIDGFNLYFGMRSCGWRRYYWLDPTKLVSHIARAGSQIVRTVYCTARISRPEDKRRRQLTYLEALESLPACEVLYGKYQEEPARCRTCGAEWTVPKEKMTDAQLVACIVSDAFLNIYDTALVISADADLVPAVRAVQANFAAKQIVAVMPPGRKCQELQNICSQTKQIWEDALKTSQLPDVVHGSTHRWQRPPEWS